MYTHILLPTDGSKLSGKAVKQGVQLAKSIRAKVTAIHVMPEYEVVLDEAFAGPSIANFQQRFDEESKKRARKILEQAKAEAAAAKVVCDVVTVTSRAPYDAIIRQARKSKCDLIVMASHGRKGLSSLLLGSETAKVLTHSKVPVLVVR